MVSHSYLYLFYFYNNLLLTEYVIADNSYLLKIRNKEKITINENDIMNINDLLSGNESFTVK